MLEVEKVGKGLSYTPRGQGTPKEAHGSALFCLLDGPAELALEGLNIEELCVVNTTRLEGHWMTFSV